MIVIASFNRTRLFPRIGSRSVGTSPRDESDTLQLLRQNVAIELLLGIGIVIIVGALGVMAPGAEPGSHIH